jgi:hypothetical protein
MAAFATSAAPDRPHGLVATITGQCHRYTPYEIFPMAASGRNESTRPSTPRGEATRWAISATVDTATSDMTPRYSDGSDRGSVATKWPTTASAATASVPYSQRAIRPTGSRPLATTTASTAPTNSASARVSSP